jgi:hypothetical protein
MAILLVAIDGYYIGGYWWLFYSWLLINIYWWLLMVILLVDIDGYFIGGYWWLLMAILFVAID